MNTKRELLDADIRIGGRRYHCAACLAQRKIAKDELAGGVEIKGAGAFVDAAMSATKAVS